MSYVRLVSSTVAIFSIQLTDRKIPSSDRFVTMNSCT